MVGHYLRVGWLPASLDETATEQERFNALAQNLINTFDLQTFSSLPLSFVIPSNTDTFAFLAILYDSTAPDFNVLEFSGVNQINTFREHSGALTVDESGISVNYGVFISIDRISNLAGRSSYQLGGIK